MTDSEARPQENSYKSLRHWADRSEHILAVVGAGIGSVWLTFWPSHASVDAALAGIFGILVLLCIHQIRMEFRDADEAKVAANLSDRFEIVEQAINAFAQRSDHVIGALQNIGRMIDCPTGDSSSGDVYVSLFGGFSGPFQAYNPAYNIEHESLTAMELKLVEEVYVPRYKNPVSCSARYLFYTGDQEGRNSLDRFKKLMRKVLERGCEQVISSIHIREVKKKRAEAHEEVYFGTQHGREVVVCELATPMDSHGKPSFYYVSESTEFFRRCLRHFNSEWQDAEDVYKYDKDQPSRSKQIFELF